MKTVGIRDVFYLPEVSKKPFKNMCKMNILPPKVAAGRCHTSTPVGRAGVRLMGLCLPSVETCVSQVNHAKLITGEGVGSMGAVK